MNLTNLPKVVARRKKALGRGIGSGKGKTSGRGMKGQKARGKVPAANVGAGLILYKKLPFRRGWTRNGGNPARSPKPVIVTLDSLNKFKANSVVNVESLIKNGLLSQKEFKYRSVKLLVKGELSIPLTVEIPVSENARILIEKAGGKAASREKVAS